MCYLLFVHFESHFALGLLWNVSPIAGIIYHCTCVEQAIAKPVAHIAPDSVGDPISVIEILLFGSENDDVLHITPCKAGTETNENSTKVKSTVRDLGKENE